MGPPPFAWDRAGTRASSPSAVLFLLLIGADRLHPCLPGFGWSSDGPVCLSLKNLTDADVESSFGLLGKGTGGPAPALSRLAGPRCTASLLLGVALQYRQSHTRLPHAGQQTAGGLCSLGTKNGFYIFMWLQKQTNKQARRRTMYGVKKGWYV